MEVLLLSLLQSITIYGESDCLWGRTPPAQDQSCSVEGIFCTTPGHLPQTPKTVVFPHIVDVVREPPGHCTPPASEQPLSIPGPQPGYVGMCHAGLSFQQIRSQ